MLNVKNNMSDAHITKHIDWGAMAYLSQSRYGKMGNKNYIGTNKEIYRNPSSYSGRGEDIVQTEYSYIEAEKYSYNDHKCLESDSNNCTGEKVKNAGVGASTTGTIYGIYDVSGLAQVAMGKYTDNPTNGFNVNPAIKYLTIYKDSINRKKEKDVLGDGLFETNGWYKDYGSANFNDAYVFLTRGSNYNNTLSGIFGFGVMNINAYTFRIVLIP